MELYTSDSSISDGEIPDQKIMDYGHSNLTTDYVENDFFGYKVNTVTDTILLNHNALISVPLSISKFINLKVLDLSSNNLVELPDVITQCPLKTLIAKNNRLTNDSLPKSLLKKSGSMRELNLSGNCFTHFPEQVLELTSLKYLYLGGNKITNVSKDIWKLKRLVLKDFFF
jgi:Leucine-rich repeat (LRR) protein